MSRVGMGGMDGMMVEGSEGEMLALVLRWAAFVSFRGLAGLVDDIIVKSRVEERTGCGDSFKLCFVAK